MNREAAARLVNQFISTWPNGVRGNIWSQVIEGLDERLTNMTYAFLRDHEDRPPSINRFRETYRQIRKRETPVEQPTLEDHEPTMSLGEYLNRLEFRARTSPDAARELAAWDRLSQSTFGAILPGLAQPGG